MISNPEDRVLQVTAITGCNDFQAEVVLKRCDWDVNVAVNSYFDNPPPERPERAPASFSSNAVAPFRNETHDARGWDQPPTYQPPTAPPSSTAAESDRGVIDLTKDADDDLRKAMAESLEQSRPREPASDQNGDVQMSEDEQLRQALEASVQSHHDLLQGNGSGARTPILPQHLDLDQHQRRQPDAPVALTAPYSSLDVIALLLQALYAATPAREAFLTARPADDRISDLLNYWKGASPTKDETEVPRRGRSGAIQSNFELTQRIQTLFGFMTTSYRSLCVIKDVSSLAPTEVVARGADNSAALQVAVLYFSYVMHKFDNHVSTIKASTDEPAPAPWLDDFLFKTAGAAAFTAPPTPPSDDKLGEYASAPPPGAVNTRHHILLRHDSVDADILSCLRAALARDGEGALLTRPAKVLNMGIEHTADTLFRIDQTIYLDSLMWDRRQGMRLESEQHNVELSRLGYAVQQLHARKRKLMGDNGKLSIDLLQQTKHYFDQLATVNGQDPVRASMHREAAPRLANIVEALQQDLTATDQLILRVEAKMDAKRSEMQQRAYKEAENPDWKQMAYDLSAVLCQTALGWTSYVKQPNGTWWKVANGTCHAITTDQIASDGVFWVVYSHAGTNASETTDALVPETVQTAIVEDNLTFESELLSLIVSDTSSNSQEEPSTTDTLMADTVQ